MNIHKIDWNKLPEEEVLAFGYGQNILVGELEKGFNADTICIICKGYENEQMDECTHYILASELIDYFKEEIEKTNQQ